MSYNKVVLIGNLTRDPELRYTPQGIPVSTLRLAVNTDFRSKSGEKVRETIFINVNVWNKQAELCNQYLSKGRQILVEGRLRQRSWQTQDGSKRTILEVRADRIHFLGRKPKEEEVEVDLGPLPEEFEDIAEESS